MLDCKIHGANDLRLEPTAMPEPGPGQVLLRLGAGGICGSDMHYFFEGRVGSFKIREPLTPGHEASGVVAKVGDGVTRLKEGDKVAINPSHPCGKCDNCRDGRENLCREMRFLGSASLFPHVQGMFREYFLMGERQLTPVAADVSLGELACCEPFSVGLHSVNRIGMPLVGKSVLVTGAGTIGCMTVLAARLFGAAKIIVTDVVDNPLSVARSVGADVGVRVDKLPAGTSLAEAIGEVDVALEVAGNPAALLSCLEATRKGGTIVQVGTLPPEGMHFPANQIMARELNYIGSFRFGNVFDWAVRYISERRIDVRPLISSQHKITDAVEAFNIAKDKTRSTKVQLVCA
ncbi:MAG: L-idonate 5-dehydrogenase [Vicinamibacterales bacterium]